MPRHSLLNTRVIPRFDWPLGTGGGRMAWFRRRWLAPICVCRGLVRRLGERRRPPHREVAPGLLQGRRLSAREAAWALGDGVVAVVDLCTEIAQPLPLYDLPRLDLPLLPGTGPSEAQLRAALAFIGRYRSRGKVLVVCPDGDARGRHLAALYPQFPQKYRSDDAA